jgi:hypothetical protein
VIHGTNQTRDERDEARTLDETEQHLEAAVERLGTMEEEIAQMRKSLALSLTRVKTCRQRNDDKRKGGNSSV